MANNGPQRIGEKAPWEGNGPVKGRLSRVVPWMIGAAMVAAIAYGLRAKPVEVETGLVARAPLTVRISEEGKTRIRNRYVVAAPVAGRMSRVSLKPGDAVKPTETILTAIQPVVAPLIDPRAKLLAEAVVSSRQANRDRAAEAVAMSRAAFELAEAERERYRSIRSDAVSKADRDRAEAEATMCAADLRASQFALQVAEHEFEQAKAALERPPVSVEGNAVEVRSPVPGVLLNVMQESETVVSPGMAIAEVGDPGDLEIEAEILSRDAVAMKPGDLVQIEQWGGPRPLEARVRRIEPAAFTKISALGVEEQRVYVLCDLVNPPPEARTLGDRYRVEVRVAVWHADDVLVVPAGALFREGNQWKTFVFRDGVAVSVSLEAGHTDGRFTEVLAGLEEGDEVLLHPPDTVKNGSPVRRRRREP